MQLRLERQVIRCDARCMRHVHAHIRKPAMWMRKDAIERKQGQPRGKRWNCRTPVRGADRDRMKTPVRPNRILHIRNVMQTILVKSNEDRH